MRYFVVLFLLLIVKSSFAQEGAYAEATGRCVVVNITPEQAELNALNDAQRKAIEQVSGVRVTEYFQRHQIEVIGDQPNEFIDIVNKFCLTSSTARIIKQEYTSEKAIENGEIVIYVYIRAWIKEEKGEPDPNFKVSVSTDKPYYFFERPGLSDEVNFAIKATQDCYVYVFNVYDNDTVRLILPNNDLPDNFYRVGIEKQRWEITKANIGLHFWTALSEGKTQSSEGLYVVALKNKLDFISANFSSVIPDVIPTYKAALTDIMNWIMQIPADRRAENYQTYFIRKKTNH